MSTQKEAFAALVSDVEAGIMRLRQEKAPEAHVRREEVKPLINRSTRKPLLYAAEAQRAATRFGFREVNSKKFAGKLNAALAVNESSGAYTVGFSLDQKGQWVVTINNVWW